jgi:Cu2+-exporting ATPase
VAVTFEAASQPTCPPSCAGRRRSRAARPAGDRRPVRRLHRQDRARNGALPGVDSARLNLSTGRLSLGLENAGVDPGRIIAALARLGYPATPYDPGAALVQRDREGRRLILALAVAGFGAMNAMMFSVPIWAGLFDQELGPATRSADDVDVGGRRRHALRHLRRVTFFQSAWRSLRARAGEHGRADLDRRDPDPGDQLLRDDPERSRRLFRRRRLAAVPAADRALAGSQVLRAKARSAAGDLLALQAPVACVIDSPAASDRSRSAMSSPATSCASGPATASRSTPPSRPASPARQQPADRRERARTGRPRAAVPGGRRQPVGSSDAQGPAPGPRIRRSRPSPA